MHNSAIKSIIKNTSIKLLDVYENFHDHFSLETLENIASYNIFANSTFKFHTLPSTNTNARQLLQHQIKNLSQLNFNADLTKFIMSELPISCQSYVTSPYLDRSLFIYDIKLVSNFDRPSPASDQIIKFYNRETDRLSFRLYTGKQKAHIFDKSNALPKRFVTFIWHPYEPFCISVQRSSNEYTVNFHVYNNKHQ